MRCKRMESLDPRKCTPFWACGNQEVGADFEGRGEGFSWSGEAQNG
jgi:hypothetical protein